MGLAYLPTGLTAEVWAFMRSRRRLTHPADLENPIWA